MDLSIGQRKVLAEFLANLAVALIGATVIAPIFTNQRGNLWLMIGSGIGVSTVLLFTSMSFAKEIQ